MKQAPKKLQLQKITIAKLTGPVTDLKKAPTVADWTCNFTDRTCVSIEFSC